jgi:hypothetical protein
MNVDAIEERAGNFGYIALDPVTGLTNETIAERSDTSDRGASGKPCGRRNVLTRARLQRNTCGIANFQLSGGPGQCLRQYRAECFSM